MRSSVALATVSSSVMLLGLSHAHADAFEEEKLTKYAKRAVWTRTEAGLSPVEAGVTLVCPPDWKGAEFVCNARLEVELPDRKVLKLDTGVPSIRFEAKSDDIPSLDLQLLAAGDARLILVYAGYVTTRHPSDDEIVSTFKSTGGLYMIDGGQLRQIYRWTAQDVQQRQTRDVVDFEYGKKQHHTERFVIDAEEPVTGFPKLLVRELVGSNNHATQVLSWDGKNYVVCTTCTWVDAKDRPKPKLAPTPTAPTPAKATPPAEPPPDLRDPSGKSLEPLLAQMFAGQAIDARELVPLSEDSLLKLRNAPYARHGRPFKMKVLQTFFYDARTGAMQSKLLPRVPNPEFKESMLDETDLQNVRAVVNEQKRRGG